MSGVKVTNERPARPIPTGDSVTGVVDGSDNVDWDPPSGGGVAELDQWKQPVRAATTANITISTALNNGDTLDGVTLATGDRVLVKDQSTHSQNGIYVVGASPARASDMDSDDEVLGAAVYVIAGSQTGTIWAVTNTSATVVDTDAIDWAEAGGGAAAREWELWNEGGDPLVKAHGAFGVAETIDPTDGNVHTGTLDADCTVTLAAPTGTAATLLLWLTQDGTGGRDITWAGSVTEIGTPDTTLGVTNIAVAATVDGGTTWVVSWVGGGGGVTGFATPAIVLDTAAAAGVATTVIRSDATIVAFDATAPVTQAFGDAADTGSAAVAARRDHVHGMPAAPATGGGGTHEHVVSEAHLSDGSTGTYTLDQAYQSGSVIAWNTTALARLTVTEAEPDSATVSPVGTAGDTIMFDYAAVLV